MQGMEERVSLPGDFGEILRMSNGRPFAFDHGDMRTLHFDGRYIQSAMSISEPDRLLLSYTRCMMGFLMFNRDPRHIVMIGLGGGSLAKFCYRRLPKARITVLEIDADVIGLRSLFQIPEDDERFQIIHVDATEHMKILDQPVDVILHDGFGMDGIATSLVTQSFYRQCYSAMTENGLIASNFWTDTPDLLQQMQALYAVFGKKMWWINMPTDFNRVVFSMKGAPVLKQYELTQLGAGIDLNYDLGLQETMRNIHTAYDKSLGDFQLVAGSELPFIE